ncbi:MAG TPA: cytochrome b/b6 domain-containing protein [Minicystis sp.]|nr:cytochrome b/b6 domain-containing protein [Minicystis sp.]
MPTTRVLVWDLPTRILHFGLAACFVGAFVIAVFVRHRSAAFPLHMLLGAVAAFVIVLRIVWGFVGSRYARFRTFAFGPRALLAYLRGMISAAGEDHVGHNPANAWAAFAMLASILGAAVTGALISVGGRPVREIHEVFAYGAVTIVVVHLAGIALHTLRRRENIALGMIDGKKAAAPALAIRSARPVAALVLLAAIGAWAGVLVAGYDAAQHTETIPGLEVSIKLGGGRQAPAIPRARS